MRIISQKPIFLKTGLMVTGSSKIWVGVDDKPRELPDLSQGFKRIYSQESTEGTIKTFDLISQVTPPPPYFILEMAITVTGTTVAGDYSTPVLHIGLTCEGISNKLLDTSIWGLSSGVNSFVYRTMLVCIVVYNSTYNWDASTKLCDYNITYTNQSVSSTAAYYMSNKRLTFGMSCEHFNATKYSTTITTYSM